MYVNVDNMPRTRAQQIEEDRKATQTFRSSEPPDYIGTTVEHEGPAVVMEPVVEEEPVEEHPEEEDPIVGDEAPTLMADYPDMMEPILPWTTEYNLRADSWVRKPNESMVDYTERFHREILSVIPYEETYQ